MGHRAFNSYAFVLRASDARQTDRDREENTFFLSTF